MAITIAVANQKGGVGKTTTCVNLTAALKKRGRRVLLVDCDPQGNSTSGMGVDKQTRPNCYDMMINGAEAADCVRHTKWGDVLPANVNLSGCSVELVQLPKREQVMKTALTPIRDDYDFILIDCPPSLELLTINALAAADSVLIPVQCEYYALEGIADLMRTIQMCNRGVNPALEVAHESLGAGRGRGAQVLRQKGLENCNPAQCAALRGAEPSETCHRL